MILKFIILLTILDLYILLLHCSMQIYWFSGFPVLDRSTHIWILEKHFTIKSIATYCKVGPYNLLIEFDRLNVKDKSVEALECGEYVLNVLLPVQCSFHSTVTQSGSILLHSLHSIRTYRGIQTKFIRGS